MVQISASLLAADYAQLGEEVQRAVTAGVDSFHFDMMDGHYVPNIAFAPEHLTALRPYSRLPFIAHLELSNPDEVLSRFDTFPADTIIVQWDTLNDPHKTFEGIHARGAKIGLGLNPDERIEGILRLLQDLDLLLILGVYPGFGGQTMQPGTVEKIRIARALKNDLKPTITIAVDGGVKPENAASLVEAGADCLIMGTALFQSSDMTGIVHLVKGSIAGSPRR
jgi:ribulose-phosphate 3-epimerase